MNTQENVTAANVVDVVIDFIKTRVTPSCVETLAPVLKLKQSSSAIDKRGQIVVSQESIDCFAVKGDTLTTSPGMAELVIERLRAAGRNPAVRDLRQFDASTNPDVTLHDRVTPEQARLLEAVGGTPLGRIVVERRSDVFDTVTMLLRYFYRGKTLVVVPGKEEVDEWARRLTQELGEEVRRPLRYDISSEVRLYVGTPWVFVNGLSQLDENWTQFLYVGKETILGNNALLSHRTLPASRKYAILSVDDELDAKDMLRAEYVAGLEIYRKESSGSRRVEVSVMTPPETPLRVPKGHACERKRTMIWSNDRRNRYVASVAEAAAAADAHKLFLLGATADRSLAALRERRGETLAVVILVENEEHARELQQMLPGWDTLSRNGVTHGASEDKGTKQAGNNGRIVTMAHADQHGVAADVIVRADGTNTLWQSKWGPNRSRHEQGEGRCLLIDIQDAHDADGRRNAELRRRDYETRGWAQNGLCRMNVET